MWDRIVVEEVLVSHSQVRHCDCGSFLVLTDWTPSGTVGQGGDARWSVEGFWGSDGRYKSRWTTLAPTE